MKEGGCRIERSCVWLALRPLARSTIAATVVRRRTDVGRNDLFSPMFGDKHARGRVSEIDDLSYGEGTEVNAIHHFREFPRQADIHRKIEPCNVSATASSGETLRRVRQRATGGALKEFRREIITVSSCVGSTSAASGARS